MKKISFLSLVFLCFIVSPVFSQAYFTPELVEIMSQKGDAEKIRINIRLSSQYDHQHLFSQSRRIIDPSSRRQFVVEELKRFTADEQSSLLEYLEQMQTQGHVDDIRPLWIGNMISCKASPEAIVNLTWRKDIARVDYDQARQMLDVHWNENNKEQTKAENETSPSIVWSVSHVNAPQVWSQGITGEDVIVAVIDSGINYNHLDLLGRMWEHPDYPFHGYNFIKNNHSTIDNRGHGTHCAGTVAGNGTAGVMTGIAPGATIMSLKVSNEDGASTEAAVWAAIQFAVEYGAHVMSISLGWINTWNPDRAMWRTAMNNALSAGVIASVGAGNEATSTFLVPPIQVRTPGDVPPPWTHPHQTLQGGNSAVVSVGSTTITDQISEFSSKGPVTWQNVIPFYDYPYGEQMGLIRPDVTAPGSDITSLSNTSNTGYRVSSGTSMATPAVAGLMALMLSKNAYLLPEEVCQIIQETAVPLSLFKNNTFGSGRIDVLAAVNEVPYRAISFKSYTINDYLGNNDGLINPGETVSLDITLENNAEESYQDVMFSISVNSSYLTLHDTIIAIGDFQALEQKTFPALISFDVANNFPGNQTVEFTIHSWEPQQPSIRWRSKFFVEPVAPHPLVTAVVIDDAQHGNSNGMLDPAERANVRIFIENKGLLASDDINVTLNTLNPFISLTVNQQTAGPILPDGQGFVDFEVMVHQGTSHGSIVEFDIGFISGFYEIQKNVVLKVGPVIEDWSSGGFENMQWQNNSPVPWTIQSGEVFNGDFAARSGAITGQSETALQIQMKVFATDSISFHKKVSSENFYDWLEFYINGSRKGRWSGETPWTRVSFDIEPGENIFKWVYVKDHNVDAGQDCAWIDMIEFPSGNITSVFAGNDMIVCGPEQLEFQAKAWYYDTFSWETTGDGSFSDESELNTWYLAGNNDLQNGFVTIVFNAQLQDFPSKADSVNVFFYPEVFVDLGDDRTLCRHSTLILDAGEGFVSFLWNDGSDQQTLIVDPANHPEPQANFWVIATDENGCNATDTILITFDACTGIVKLPGNSNLTLFPNPASGFVTISWENNGSEVSYLGVYSTTGQLLLQHKVAETNGRNQFDLNLHNLKAGTYLLRFENKYLNQTIKLMIN
jgi:subtilisin family serine protease